MDFHLSPRGAALCRRAVFVIASIWIAGFSRIGAAAPNSGATIIVLDASGSMRGRIGGETKMEIARRSVRELVEALPADTPLGLVVYSHRKSGDCKDIELVIAPGPLDKSAFVAAVAGIEPRGMTPLTDAVEFAANALDYMKKKANVILVSDGEETCGRNPCETAARLEKAGKDLTIHAVAFDLGGKASQSFACLADLTGGRFLQANDAASLKDALMLAVAESTVATAPAAEKLGEATLQAPRTVPAGAKFPVAWTGPDNPGDFLTIVAASSSGSDAGGSNFTYTHQGSPAQMTALIEPGRAELRYVTGRSHTVLARAEITITSTEITLAAADRAPVGSRVSIIWTGPNNDGDFITIVPATAADGEYAGYADTRVGSPASVTAPINPGHVEIRYMSGQGRKVLGRRALELVAVDVVLEAATEAAAGSTVAITWSGPANEGDYLTIVPASLGDDRYAEFAYAERGSPVGVRAPIEAGPCEIRYVSGQGRKVLGRRALKVVPVEVSLSATDQTQAGSPVTITWTGPNYPGDYITIVPKNLPDGRYADYANTSASATLTVRAPIDTGEAEIRYMAAQGSRVLGRRALRVVAAELSLDAPAEATVGAAVSITWNGPGNRGDYITIVPKSYRDGQYAKYTDTSAGSPLKVVAPIEAGECEIRYMSGQGARVLARRPLRTVPAQVSLKAVGPAVAGALIVIEWAGPDNPGDYITVVEKSAPDGTYYRYVPTSSGSPLRVQAPAKAGPAEIRYMSAQGGAVLGRAPLDLTAAPAK